MSIELVSQPGPLKRAWQSPGLLLIAVGILLGLNFPLGKVAMAAGVSPIVWSGLISAGGALVLGCAVAVLRLPVKVDWNHLRYFGVVAIVSYAFPNVLVYSLIPKLGSGYIAIFFTLSPMFTVALSLTARLRSPGAVELGGVAVGFAGAMLVASARGQAGQNVDWHWAMVGLLIPLSLAAGNVYRTLDWPKDANLLWLAVGSNALSALCLIALSIITGDIATAPLLLAIPGLVVAQVAASALMFALFFRLQAVGGPVTLSQIGTVAAAVGVMIGTFGFGERYALTVWSGVALIAVGISLTLYARLKG
jgi:drug/metabolite transporter (DMT)-like permease